MNGNGAARLHLQNCASVPVRGRSLRCATVSCGRAEPFCQRCCERRHFWRCASRTHGAHSQQHHTCSRLPTKTGGVQDGCQQVLAGALLDQRKNLQAQHTEPVVACRSVICPNLLRATAGAVPRIWTDCHTKCRFKRHCTTHRPATRRSSQHRPPRHLCCNGSADVRCRAGTG